MFTYTKAAGKGELRGVGFKRGGGPEGSREKRGEKQSKWGVDLIFLCPIRSLIDGWLDMF